MSMCVATGVCVWGGGSHPDLTGMKHEWEDDDDDAEDG